MATIVRFKSILGGTYGDSNAGVNLVSTYRSAYSGDGGASLDFNTVRDDFRQKLVVDLKNRFQPVYGFSSAKIVTATSVTTRIGIQIIFNPAGFGGEYVSYTDNAGITFAPSPGQAINRWQQGDIDTSAYATTAQIIALGIAAVDGVVPGGATKQPVYFTDGTTMGMVLHPAVSFGGVPDWAFYNLEYFIPQSAFQLVYADQWGTATRSNGYIWLGGEGGKGGEGGWGFFGSSQLRDFNMGPFVDDGLGTLPIWSNETTAYCNGGSGSYFGGLNSLWGSNSRREPNSYSGVCG